MILDIDINEVSEYLTDMEIELRKLTHEPDCKNFRSCPQHCDCEKTLNTSTKLAWDAADYIELAHRAILDKDKHIYTEAHEAIITLSGVVFPHDPDIRNILLNVRDVFAMLIVRGYWNEKKEADKNE